MENLISVNALTEAGINYVPVPEGRVDEITTRMLNNLITEDLILNSTNLDEIKGVSNQFSVDGAEEFWKLIDNLLDQHIILTADLIREANLIELGRLDYLRDSYKQFDDLIYNASPDINKYTQRFYDIGKQDAAGKMKVSAFMGTVDTNALYHLSNYNFDLIKNMNMDLRMEVRQRVWQGVARDQSPSQIARRIEKLPLEPVKAGKRMITPKARAKMIAHTESVRARTQGQLISFKQYGIRFKEIVTKPGACPICKAIRADNPYPIDDDTNPPFHPFCRCGVIPVDDPLDKPENIKDYPDLVSGETVPVNPDLIFNI